MPLPRGQLRRSMGQRISLLLLLFCLAAGQAPGSAQARGLLLDWPFYSYLDRPRWDLNLDYRYDLRETTRPEGSTRTSSHIFTEGFTVATRGWAYHPALVHFNLALSPSWQQEVRRDSEGRDGRGKGARLEYDLDGTLLALKPYALDFFAGRTLSTRVSPQAVTTDLDQTRYGLSTTLPWWQESFPTKVRYRHQALERQTLGTPATTSTTDSWFVDALQQKERSTTSLNASHSSTQQGGGRAMGGSSQTTTGRLQNTLILTEDRELKLNSRFRGRWSESILGARSENLNLTEHLIWDRQHAEHFSSHYDARYEQQRTDGLVDNTYELGAGLNHRLYENLLTSLRARAEKESSEVREHDRYLGNLNMNYGRRIPTGFLNLNLGQEYRIDQREVTARFEEIRESFLLDSCLENGELPLFDCEFRLSRFAADFVERESLELELIPPPPAPEAPPPPVPPVDPNDIYSDRVDGEVVVIVFDTRLLDPEEEIFGQGWTLLVRYRARLEPGYDGATWTRNYGGRLNFWQYWTVHYRTSRSEERLLAGTPPTNLRDDQSYDTGIAWQRAFGATSLSSAFNYREASSATSSSRGPQFSAGLGRRFREGQTTMRNTFTYSKTLSTFLRSEIIAGEDPREITVVDEIHRYNLVSAFDFRLPANRRLSVQGEYDKMTASDEERWEESYRLAADLRLRAGLRASLSGRLAKLEVRESDREDERREVRARLQQRIGRHASLRLDGMYRLRTTNQPQRTKIYTLVGGYEYRLRFLTLSADYRYSDEHRTAAGIRTTNNTFMLGLKRALN
ncbi:hypothetical protein [Desulfurivibrio sp. C05AmB]|uniref:hypothetical protein n=1 Tax=Desulfurivibrio sp. C05AmB TaxID=3374371 RepID=UPI00376F0978